MKIPSILLTRAALAMILDDQSASKLPPAWFNWHLKMSDGSLARITLHETLDPDSFAAWLGTVRQQGCAAVVLLTSDDDPISKYFGIDSERDYLTVTVDFMDDIDLWRLRVDIASPESEYLDQWASFALGAGVPFRWLQAHDGLWRAYAEGLRVWTEEPSARQWLENLDAVDYTPMSPDLELTPEEFEIPDKITPEQAQDSFFPSIYNPAFGIRLHNRQLSTFGIRVSPDKEWSFDRSNAIRDEIMHRIQVKSQISISAISKITDWLKTVVPRLSVTGIQASSPILAGANDGSARDSSRKTGQFSWTQDEVGFELLVEENSVILNVIGAPDFRPSNLFWIAENDLSSAPDSAITPLSFQLEMIRAGRFRVLKMRITQVRPRKLGMTKHDHDPRLWLPWVS